MSIGEKGDFHSVAYSDNHAYRSGCSLHAIAAPVEKITLKG